MKPRAPLSALLAVLLGALPASAQLRSAAVRPSLPAAGGQAAAAAGLSALPKSLFSSPDLPPNGALPAAPPAAPAASLSARVMAKVLAEDPAARAELVASFESAHFRPALGPVADPDAYLSERLGEAFVPYFETYAREVGHADAESGMRYLLSEEPSAVETRRGLGRLLRSGSVRSESWTYVFRDAELWRKPLADYLDGRVAARRASGDRSLHLQSVGAAYGAEPYTLAILTEEALTRAGEDPKAWDVRIDAADLSLMSLVSAREGFYRDPEGGPYFIPRYAGEALRREAAAGRLLPAGTPGLYRLREDLRGWVRPMYLDLNDARQHRAVTAARPDVVFANYVLTHLRLGPAVALAEHWLSGLWSDHGFLSMAQTLVAEVSARGRLAAKGRLGAPGAFLRTVSLTVGAIGGSYAGDSAEPWQRLRDWLWSSRSRTAKRALAAAARYRQALWKDPFHAEALDPAALAVLERVAAETGARVELSADATVPVGMFRDEAVAVSVGLLLPGGGDPAARAAFLERQVRAYAAKAVKGAAPAREFSDPRFGPGTVAAEGTHSAGARLKAVRFADGPRLLWLVPGRLAPITDDYKDEKPPQKPRPPGAGGGGGGITIRM